MSSFGITLYYCDFLELVTARERRTVSLPDGTVVASLDVLIRILENPDWNEKAKKVKTLKEMCQIILDFCEANGKVVTIDKETSYAYP